ncbi:ATP-binding cassette domain-containing protein [Flagellimonas pacifica]|uniref:Molybdate transport system ATP-binding protein n=1 Tax=Flagellimonas pacifica TaxID=1247520 RepID=A0A285MXD4_9FLAO|nr:ATP-binding cassette domain-containing protein [Allomuricauda parva]SNZ01842.1 molybdate transport system ATP-binding protein [Allomuricauda parva]
MNQPKNYAILIDNKSQTKVLVSDLLKGILKNDFPALDKQSGLLFSRSEVERFMDEEERHGTKIITKKSSQSLKSMSSGEQKKALLAHQLTQEPGFLVLVNPYDNLDIVTQSYLQEQLVSIAKSISLVQIVSRLDDILPDTTDFFKLDEGELLSYSNANIFWKENAKKSIEFTEVIPPPIEPIVVKDDELVNFKNVSVSFDERQVLNNINWTVKKGEFWQLIGPNGSGKTTLLSMITGDSHKGYGQNLTLFGQKKGSGESVWDLKEKIGYFTPAMTDKFNGYHTLENMVISGIYDSIGLYKKASDQAKRLAGSWVKLLQLQDKRKKQFHELTSGEKRLVMTARAMIKHPPLLILDEPTAGLDDENAALFVSLVNKIAQESETAIIFVSHRKEIGLDPQFDYILEMKSSGSAGKKITHANS